LSRKKGGELNCVHLSESAKLNPVAGIS